MTGGLGGGCEAVRAALSAPFDPRDVKFKPQMVKNNRALAMAYIDARLVMERLDEVIGVENWQDEYQSLADGSVQCQLRVRFPTSDEWVCKSDVGSPSEQPDAGDRLKAAFSDALKRAAVKFGIGRYLYRLSAQWVDYDPVKKQLLEFPALPAFARPAAVPAAALPGSGQELHRRLRDYDAKLASQKLCNVGALLAHVTQAGVKAGYTANMNEWSGPAIQFAVDAVKEFEESCRRPREGARAG